ncbi:endonuclease/exonuclease/phosphatase family protein [Sinomicrobium soli]|uniref:endonuclease/exonuclease/phosphatase family protein n=1 Tax=Sinomicrobium sp. N-1-3-6 TaxID=2219864 RepID=UPI000DCB76C7|nr:endonuclease [Sinomicrobium sp. N-1-3-6]RAV28348.1 endonuclease [Sinomicrobium sp. N-1-3-6]
MFFKRKPPTRRYTIGFYNLENLFDTRNDPRTLDDDFTPDGVLHWTPKRYRNKLYKLGKAIAHTGRETSRRSPVIMGLAEVENRMVLGELLKSKHLSDKGYEIVHYDSPDERGIDTALIYRQKYFEVLDQEAVPLIVNSVNGMRDYTRDILHVTGLLNGERIHVIVNHWPSRREGEEDTAYKRVAAAAGVHRIMDRVRETEDAPRFIIMGDFNDNPFSKSIREHLLSPDLFNPMELLLSHDKGSASYNFKWNLFDQILFSRDFMVTEAGKHSYVEANIFNDRFLTEWTGRFKGNPFRTYAGRRYLGGYSDHFPVYIQLELNM